MCSGCFCLWDLSNEHREKRQVMSQYEVTMEAWIAILIAYLIAGIGVRWELRETKKLREAEKDKKE